MVGVPVLVLVALDGAADGLIIVSISQTRSMEAYLHDGVEELG